MSCLAHLLQKLTGVNSLNDKKQIQAGAELCQAKHRSKVCVNFAKFSQAKAPAGLSSIIITVGHPAIEYKFQARAILGSSLSRSFLPVGAVT